MSMEPRDVVGIKGLLAEGPDPKLKEKLMLFGQFIGDWDIIEARYPQLYGTEIKRKGEIHFGWILGGKAIQDVWSMMEKPHQVVPIGTTIRFYDDELDAWRSTWISPVQGVVQSFIGRKVNDEIVLESSLGDGTVERWTFSHISPNSFHWRAEITKDDGRTWLLTEEMKIRRKGSIGRSSVD